MDVRAAATPDAVRHVLLQSGFRPFFFLAGAQATTAMGAWLLVLQGGWTPPVAWPSLYWHAHEMLFGFVAAAMAGFLLTAVPNWTGTPRIGGMPLLGLVAAWIAGRAALWGGDGLPDALASAADLAFLPLLAVAVGLPIFRSGKRRNYPVVAILLLLTAANACTHLGALGLAPTATRFGLRLAFFLAVALLVLISGRILPLFTRNALRAQGLQHAVESRPALERSLAAAVICSALLSLFDEGSGVTGVVSLTCSALLFARQACWQPHRSRGFPILWVLHVGHAWLVVGFACIGLSCLVPSFPSATALHALGAGAIGTSVIGVMTRVALGHTGRPIEASKPMVVAYLLVIFGAVIRVFGPLLFVDAYLAVILLGGIAWSAGYGLFLASSWKMLLQPRVDGLPG